MGAPLGNRNSAKGKPWAEALNKALLRYQTDDMKRDARMALDVIAEQVVIAAMGGDQTAISEIANRMDGKPMQPVELDANIRECTLTDKPLTQEEWDRAYGADSTH